jgi:NAD(P)-dependent dehydrogenase (short-subunit alcohol dehydrogenase family)
MSKVLVITGASRGIGAAIARLAATEGWKVATSYLEQAAPAEALIREIKDAGGQAMTMQADTSEEADVLRLFDAAQSAFGAITGVVNNAGINGKVTSVADMTTADLRRMMDVNVIGAFFTVREAVRRMSTARGGQGGAIVNIGSVAATLGGSGERVHYAASKGAVISMTIGLAKEVAREGIRVNCLSPGLIETDMNPPERLARLVPSVPIGRVGSVDEIARVALFLLSPASSYMIGTNVIVSGGR